MQWAWCLIICLRKIGERVSDAAKVDQIRAGGTEALVGFIERVSIACQSGRTVDGVAVGPDTERAILVITQELFTGMINKLTRDRYRTADAGDAGTMGV